MVHVNSALLAGHALGQDDALDAAEREHLASCAHCREGLDQYRRVVTLSQDPQALEVPTPPLDRIWRSIQAELTPTRPSKAQPPQRPWWPIPYLRWPRSATGERCAGQRCTGGDARCCE